MNSIKDLFAGILMLWDASTLNATVTGGLSSLYTKGEDKPHAVMKLVSSAAQQRANTGAEKHRWDSDVFQISLFTRMGIDDTSDMAAAVIDVFNNATLDTGDAVLVKCRYRSQSYLHDAMFPNALEWVITFDLIVSEVE